MKHVPIASELLGSTRFDPPTTVQSLPALLQLWARENGDLFSNRFIGDDDQETSLTFAELDTRAKSIAAALAENAEPGQRALLVFPPGLGFVEAFFGCLYAGVLAVPSTHPKPRRPMTRIATIAEDSGATIVLTTQQTIDALDLERVPVSLKSARWIATDEVPDEKANRYETRDIAPDDIAFLQYTSGSTSDPKGVIITHSNLMYNLEMLRVAFGVEQSFGSASTAATVGWLPAFHDMGLIGGILEPLYVRSCSVIMSPASFLRRPERWLQAISDNRASINGGPNFAFDLCVRKISAEVRETLDLSCWRVAVCAAEPVRAETIQSFTEMFGECGFREEAFFPCYGLAEATLLAAADDWKMPPRVIRVRRSRLLSDNVAESSDDDHDTQALVSCGAAILDEKLAILNPESGEPCQDGEVGEICLSGPNISPGYWDRLQTDESNDRSKSQESGESSSARTGDLGFLLDGHLYITGRLKDVMVIRGRNHYPHDIELTVSQAHECLLPAAGAAFSMDNMGEQELVLVHEVDRAYRTINLDEVIRDIRRRVVDEHDIYPHAIVLIRQASLPRTTSGKPQRHRCRSEFLEGQQKEMARWMKPLSNTAEPMNGRIQPLPTVDAARSQRIRTRERDKLVEQIETNLLQWLRERGEFIDHELELDRPFAELGIDSLAAVELSNKLEDWSGVQITETVAWRYPTPTAIVHYIADEMSCISTDVESNGRKEQRAVTSGEFEKLLAAIEQMSEEDASSLVKNRSRDDENSE